MDRSQRRVVTGGAGLLGAEFCRTLAQAGASVVIADLDDGRRACQLAGELTESGHRALAVQTDVTDPASVQGDGGMPA